MSHLVLLLVLAISTTSYGRNINPSSPSWEGRIVGGEDTKIEEHPYQVSLQLKGTHWCGGSLIKPNVILTAAHCVKTFLKDAYSVRAGSTIKEEGGEVVQVADICNHPKYTNSGDDYDVLVLKLDRAFQINNSNIGLISLQNVGENVQLGTKATVTGWGDLHEYGSGSRILQKVAVPKTDDKVCQKQYLQVNINITDRMTCYGYSEGKKDSCQADSGGPLVSNGKQVGIVSFGAGCGRQNFAGVYTRLENKEIREHINNCLAKFD